jgi:RHS repeat-associated protein
MAVRDAAGNHFYTARDKLGSVRTLTARDGTWLMAEAFSPYGSSLGRDTASGGVGVALRYRWTGREYDAETGFYYLRARYYSPELRRFVRRDPIGYAGGANPYAYVGGQPLDAVDPRGTEKVNVGQGPDWHTNCRNIGCHEPDSYLGYDGLPLWADSYIIAGVAGMDAVIGYDQYVENYRKHAGNHPAIMNVWYRQDEAEPLTPDEYKNAIVGLALAEVGAWSLHSGSAFGMELITSARASLEGGYTFLNGPAIMNEVIRQNGKDVHAASYSADGHTYVVLDPGYAFRSSPACLAGTLIHETQHDFPQYGDPDIGQPGHWVVRYLTGAESTACP